MAPWTPALRALRQRKIAQAALGAPRPRADPRPVAVLPNSLVRIDPHTLKPTQVVPGVGDAPDLIVAAGGFVWITNNTLRDTSSGGLRNAGDRTLARLHDR